MTHEQTDAIMEIDRKEDLMEEFSSRLAKLIADSGKTQKQLAIDSGVTEAAISRYLHGTRLPNMAAVVKLRDALGCTLDELVG